MRQITRADWIAALRSGEFQQTTGQLRFDFNRLKPDSRSPVFGFCCLGVACQIAEIPSNHPDAGWNAGRQNGHLPLELAAMLDLRPEDEARLAAKNDHGQTFAEIADYIERELPR